MFFLCNRWLRSQGPGALQQFTAPVIPGVAATANITVDCPKEMVGRIIGKGGETISELQARSRSVGHLTALPSDVLVEVTRVLRPFGMCCA